MTLLTLSFTSLSWKDTTNCHRTASVVCWTLLRQVAHSIQQTFNISLDLLFFSLQRIRLAIFYVIVVVHKSNEKTKTSISALVGLFLTCLPSLTLGIKPVCSSYIHTSVQVFFLTG